MNVEGKKKLSSSVSETNEGLCCLKLLQTDRMIYNIELNVQGQC